jgi:hypothetical protein
VKDEVNDISIDDENTNEGYVNDVENYGNLDYFDNNEYIEEEIVDCDTDNVSDKSVVGE